MNLTQHFEPFYHPATAQDRERIAADTEAFLAAGNEIQQVPTGVSGYTHDPRKFEVAKSQARLQKLRGKA